MFVTNIRYIMHYTCTCSGLFGAFLVHVVFDDYHA